jgi:hypothetical protein
MWVSTNTKNIRYVHSGIEDLAFPNLLGGGTDFPLPTLALLAASPSRASPCDQWDIPPWNSQQRFSKRCRSSREPDEVERRGCIAHDFAKGSEIRTSMGTYN